MTWPRLAVLTVASAVAFATPTHAADDPFAGTWKLNQEKSQFTGDTMSFTAQRGGSIRFNAAGQYYTFKADGKRRAGLMRQQVAWTKVDDRTWRAAWSLKKKPVATETLAIAPDGRTLTDTVRGARADGTTFEDQIVYERTKGDGATLLGSWRSTRVNLAGFQTITIESRKPEGIVLTMVDFKSTCRAQLDGQDYPMKGPMTPPGVTMSFKSKGDRALQLLQKQSGIPLYRGTMTVDAEGRTLTWDWRPIAVNEPMKAVFERQ